MKLVQWIGVFLWSVCGAWAGEISPAGLRLIEFLDSMRVEQLWLAGATINWRTGEPDGRPLTGDGKHTHCSGFAAAACERLGIYLLHPPDHSETLLASAQYDWLKQQGAERGWSGVPDGFAAQAFANRGQLVVAVWKSPDPKKSGHIAVIRPSTKSDEALAGEGPEVTQAGGKNRVSASLKVGFASHPSAFSKGEVRYFVHKLSF